MLTALLGTGVVAAALAVALTLAIRWGRAEQRAAEALRAELVEAEAEAQRIQESHAEDVLRANRREWAMREELKKLEEEALACAAPGALVERINGLLARPSGGAPRAGG